MAVERVRHHDEELTLQGFSVRDLRECLLDNRQEAGRYFREFKIEQQASRRFSEMFMYVGLAASYATGAEEYSEELVRRGRKVPVWAAQSSMQDAKVIAKQMKAAYEKTEKSEKAARTKFDEGDVIRARSLGITLL